MITYDKQGICTRCGLQGSGFVSDGVCMCGDVTEQHVLGVSTMEQIANALMLECMFCVWHEAMHIEPHMLGNMHRALFVDRIRYLTQWDGNYGTR